MRWADSSKRMNTNQKYSDLLCLLVTQKVKDGELSIRVHYGGNFGTGQSVSTLLKACTKALSLSLSILTRAEIMPICNTDMSL